MVATASDISKALDRGIEQQKRAVLFDGLNAADPLAESTKAVGFTGLGDPLLLAIVMSAQTDTLNGNHVAALGALSILIDEIRASG